MLKKIAKCSDDGVFCEFSWPGGLCEFGRYNVVYGWNGSGKTSLSRLLSSSSWHEDKSLCCEFCLGDVFCKTDELDDFSVLPTIEVFNSDYIKDFYFKSDGKINPIYYFGRDSVSRMKEVSVTEYLLETLSRDYFVINSKYESEIKKKNKIGTDIARRIKDEIRGHEGVYKNYTKRNALSRLDQFLSASGCPKEIPENELDVAIKAMHEIPKNELAIIQRVSFDLNRISPKLHDILKESAVSKVIKELNEDQKLAEWVGSGFKLMQEGTTNICMFCGQEIPKDRITDLEAHFNESFAILRGKVESAIEYIEKLKIVLNIRLYDENRLYTQFVGDYVESVKIFHSVVDKYLDYFDRSLVVLREKLSRLFESFEFSLDVPDENINDAIDSINDIIKKHNGVSENFTKNRDSVRLRYEDHCLASVWIDYKLCVENESLYAEHKDAIRHSKKLCDIKKDALMAKAMDIGCAVAELNDDLNRYLGHNEILFELHGKDGYRLVRNGLHAKQLSEGELSAVAFVFFLRSLLDDNKDIESSIIVVDDPVSSMDANALYCAFSFMKNIVKNCGQLIILTHNFSFLNEVKKWFKRLELKGDVCYYQLLSEYRNGKRTADLQEMNMLLRDFRSDYHYLFYLVYRATKGYDDFERYYYVPNVSRRLLEAFLEFKFPQDSNLTSRVRKMAGDDADKDRVLQFIQKFSHGDAIASEVGHDPVNLGETPEIMKVLLNLMRQSDQVHYDGMMRVMRRSNLC